MGINSEYNDDYYFDDYSYFQGDEEMDASPYDDWSREDFEDLYSTELLNMWFLINEDFPRKSYRSFCDFCFDTDPRPRLTLSTPPEFVISLWNSINSECQILLDNRTVQDFFVYLYKC